MKTTNSDCSDVYFFLVDGNYLYGIYNIGLLIFLLFVLVLALKDVKILLL